MIVADRPEEFAGAVTELLRSPSRRVALGESAYRFVSAIYDWQAIAPELEQIYERLTAH